MALLEECTDFTDIKMMPIPEDTGYPIRSGVTPQLCPKCKGYGKWNRMLNVYGPGKHSQAGCNQCRGWGWVNPEDAVHIHIFGPELSKEDCEFMGIPHFGMFYHVYMCVLPNCDKILTQDSSG